MPKPNPEKYLDLPARPDAPPELSPMTLPTPGILAGAKLPGAHEGPLFVPEPARDKEGKILTAFEDCTPEQTAAFYGEYDPKQNNCIVTEPEHTVHCWRCGSVHLPTACPLEPQPNALEKFPARLSQCLTCLRLHFEGIPCPQKGQCHKCGKPPHDGLCEPEMVAHALPTTRPTPMTDLASI